MSYADNLIIYVNANTDTLDLVHGESQTITFTISHENTWCNVLCDYELKNLNTQGLLIKESNIRITPNNYLSIPYTFTAPNKDKGGVSGQIPYQLNVDCRDETSLGLLCFTSGTDTGLGSIFLNYGLTFEEQNSKSYLDSNLPSVKNNLENSEKKLYNIQTKINELPDNILISDITRDLNPYSQNLNVYRSTYDKIKIYYDNLDFLNSKSLLSESFKGQLNSLKSDVFDLDKRLEERIELHNKIAKDIKKLSDDLNKLSKDATFLNLVSSFNKIKEPIDSLTNKFESGLFNSYDTLSDEINSISGQINSLSNKISSQKQALIDNISQNILTDKDRLCKEKNYCNARINTNTREISYLCDVSLPQLKKAFDEANRLDYEAYLEKLEETLARNEIINAKNKKIEEFNNLVKETYKLINDNSLEISYEKCQESINSVRERYFLESTNANFIGSSLNECQKLKENAQEEVSKKEQSFLFKIKRFFIKIFASDKVTYKEINKKELIPEPKEPKSVEISNDVVKFSQSYCNIDLSAAPLSDIKTTLINAKGKTLTITSIKETKEHVSQCCVFGVCSKCCEGDECKNDESSFPTIFLHGHSFQKTNSPEYSLDAFDGIRRALVNEGFISTGTVLPTAKFISYTKGDWGKSGQPVVVKATYYYDVYNNEGQLINIPQKTESISTYAKRLKDIIDVVKERAGRNKVNIVAHSMGGLVARDYIRQFGSNSVHKLIMIGTPNHGLYGDVANLCDSIWSGGDGNSWIECSEMTAGSSFLNRLNSGDETPGDTKYYTIIGSGCVLTNIDGDGIVRSSSVPLAGATNFKVNGQCSGSFDRGMHSELLDPNTYPNVLSKVNEFLRE